MRPALAALVVALLTFAQQTPAPRTLTGTVVTGSAPEIKPVRRAKVTLNGAGLGTPRVTDTDAKGTFRLVDLPVGDFKVTIEKAGFVTLDAPLTPGGTVTLLRGSAIEGTVRDGSGEPIMNVAVTVSRAGAPGERPTSARTVRTDDLGRYRAHSLPEGDYIIEAATDRDFLVRALILPGEKPPSPQKVYYPGTGVSEEAKPVRLSIGRDAQAIDLVLDVSGPVRDPNAPAPAPRPDATGTARVGGRVLDATNGKPIRNAQLLLVPVDGQRLTNWTRSDGQGRFEYTSLQARRYTLRAQATRYVTLEYGQKRPGEKGRPIQVTEGENVTADISLPRASAIEGTITDEFGDPAPGIAVQLAQRMFAAGRYRLAPLTSGPPAITDDRGRYRVSGVQPGDHYVVGLSGVYADADASGGFAPTYYPGSADGGAAIPISIPFGGDADATFSLVPSRTFRLAGTMVGADGAPVAGRGVLMLVTPDRAKRAELNLARGITGADGRFSLRNVPQGIYTLQGFGPPPPGYRGPGNLGAMRFGSTTITVADSDVEDVVLRVSEGTTLRGKVVLEDARGTGPKAEAVRVTAIPIEFDSAPIGGGPPPASTNDDLSFEVSRLSGLRRIIVSLSTDQWSLRRITLDGRDVTDSPVDFREKDVDGVEVVLTGLVTRISGAVLNEKAEPVNDYAVLVFSSDPTKWMDRSRFVQPIRPTQDGTFKFHGLPPEDYLVVALPALVGTEWQDPDFLQQLRGRATPFTLNDGEAKTLQLKLQKR